MIAGKQSLVVPTPGSVKFGKAVTLNNSGQASQPYETIPNRTILSPSGRRRTP